MWHDVFHIGVVETTSVLREESTTCGLHHNIRGKMRLTHLTAESTWGGHVPNMTSNIPVVINTSPF